MTYTFSMNDTNTGKLVPFKATSLADERIVTITFFGSEAEVGEMTALASHTRALGFGDPKTGTVITKDGVIRHYVRVARGSSKDSFLALLATAGVAC